MDIVVVNFGTDEVIILLGYDNGTFSSPTTCKTGPESNPYSIAIDDFNNDNHVDIFVANYGTNSNGVYLGYGNGTFTLPTILPLGSSRPMSVAVGDFNQDNRSDIVVACSGTNNEQILLNMC